MKIENKPEHIPHLCRRPSKLLEHYRETFDQVRVSVGRKHVKGRCEKCLELYPALKRMSHKLLIAAAKYIFLDITSTKNFSMVYAKTHHKLTNKTQAYK